MKWEVVIGIEVHVQLLTHSKLFSHSPTSYGATPNSQASLIDIAMPGTLPVLNKEVIYKSITLSKAIHGKISNKSIFARKNYFYPDLPKGYQISQYEHPIISQGELQISVNNKPKTVRICRAHIEEDAGKLIHENLFSYTGVDLNRAGCPLLEIVSEPDMRSAEEAVAYLKKLHHLVCYFDICDGNMQEGSFRADINISLRPSGSTTLGTRTEIKNMNSFKFIEKAIHYEINRQQQLLENGEKVIQQTLLYDSNKNTTHPMRSKEDAHDYRYFPDPDLIPIFIEQNIIDEIQKNLPELPDVRLERLQQQYGLNLEEAEFLIHDHHYADFFENAINIEECSQSSLFIKILRGDIQAILHQKSTSLNESPFTPSQVAELIKNLENKTIALSVVKKILLYIWENVISIEQAIQQLGLQQLNNLDEINHIIQQVIATNPQQVAQYRSGKTKIISYLIGQVMKNSKGRANPNDVNRLLNEALNDGISTNNE